MVKSLFQTTFVNSLIKGLDPIHKKSISLSPGQVFNGKILKLYPGQLASLQLGGVTLTAKLEAALVVGKRYWFLVQQGDGLPVLQVFEENPGGKASENILKQLGLSNSKLTNMIVEYFAKEQLPFSRGHVVSGAETLQNVGMVNDQGMSILKFLVERNLPISSMTFSAAQSVLAGDELAKQLHELSIMFQPFQEKVPLLKQINQLLQAILTETKVDHHYILELLKTFLHEENRTPKFLNAQSELQKLGIIQKQSPEQIFTHLKGEITKTPEGELKQIFPTLTKQQMLLKLNKEQIDELLTKVVLEKGENGHRTIQQIISMFPKTGNENFAFHNSEDSLGEQIAIILKRLGYHYEKNIQQFFLNRNENREIVMKQLKALLLESLQLQIPANIQGKIESILSRITGQQLLSVNQEGPIVNYSVVVPLKLMGENSDLTIQWEGKKEMDGKLNPDHCRVIFYLHLNKLKETIIDVQIQNRIVSLHVINEQQKPLEILGVFQTYLKRALNKLNYQLTSIKWTEFKKADKNINKDEQLVNTYGQSKRHYRGVDVRI